jgi:transposase
MSGKRVYRRVSVNEIELELLKEQALVKGGKGSAVGLDLAKAEIVAVVRWSDGSFERPWNVVNPERNSVLIERLQVLRSICDSLTVGLESTGNYSEAIRCALTGASLEVHRVSGKAVSDYKEIFDGVPSQHDGKDAAMIAELTAFGKGTAWPFKLLSETDQALRHQVARIDAFRGQANQWIGRLEGMLSRHWPELTDLIKLSSVTLLKVCVHYGSPAALASDPSAASMLRRWSCGALKPAKIAAIIESARTTCGIPMGGGELAWLREIAQETQSGLAEVNACELRLQAIAGAHDSMSPLVNKVGAVTLCVIWAMVGDPRQYTSSGAFLKALGLNLKELSSGKRRGQLAISKRGPSLARKQLYYWAMRGVQQPDLRRWYVEFQQVGNSKQGSSEHRKMKGLIALMRKLCRSLWYVHRHGLEFDYAKVFPGRPLQSRTHKRKRRRVLEATPQSG